MKYKTLQILIVLLALFPLGMQAQSQPCKVLQDNFSMLQVEFTMGNLSTASVVIDNQRFTSLTADGLIASGRVGYPNLPTFSQLIETPLQYNYRIEVAEAEYDTIDARTLGAAYPIAPVQPFYSKSDTRHHALVINGQAYGQDAYIGDSLVLLEEVGIARDRNLGRIQISPIQYNARQNRLVVCRRAVITIHYSDVDAQASQDWFERYNSPAFNIGANTLNRLYSTNIGHIAPVSYLIVAHSSFRGQLDEFANWKSRKGYLTSIVYTDNSAVGSTTTSISNYLQGLYANATATHPAPSYVLFVGDVEQIPAFDGTVSIESPSSYHVTDLYYATWTSGDYIPDCYYGRFSAQNISQLTPQIEKTLMHEKYTFSDPSFLDRAVIVAGIDGGEVGDHGYVHADPAMDYAVANYINGTQGYSDVRYWRNSMSGLPSATNVSFYSSSGTYASSMVNASLNNGVGWCNYSAHGSSSGWGNPGVHNSDVSDMTNTQKFGVLIGNCCLSNKFEESTCFGEALLRKGNYCGAVGYIGASDYSYWTPDVYWTVGSRSSISSNMSYNSSHLGAYDRLNHTHGETFSDQVSTLGGIVTAGNSAVQSSSANSSMKKYYWEIYHVMGDPSLMPYITQPETMYLVSPSVVSIGTSSISMMAAPNAYVALTDTATHTIYSTAFASSSGFVTLYFSTSLPAGNYEIAVSAQNYITEFRSCDVMNSNGYMEGNLVYSNSSKTNIVACRPSAVEITIPSTVSSINADAFAGCSRLTTVHFNATNCTSMVCSNSSVFSNCPNFTTLTIGSNVQNIPDHAFDDCAHLTSVSIPNSVTNIGSYAFWRCTGLTSLTIGNGVTNIGNYAFCYLPVSVTIPSSVTSIGLQAFYNATFGSVTYNAANCTTIGNSSYPAFAGCSNLRTLTIGSDVQSIPANAFAGCTGVTSVVFNATNCTSMGSSASPLFAGFSNFVNLTIGSSVQRIPANAFKGCTHITSLIIPAAIRAVGDNAFYGCSGLARITFNATNCTTMCTGSTSVFGGCNNITTLTIGSGVTNIPYCAFDNLTRITYVSIPSSVTTIGQWAFFDCTSLTTLFIGSGVTTIERSAFYGCSALTTVNYNATNCTSMGSSEYPVFNNCSSFRTLSIGSNVQSIPAHAFRDTPITTLTIPSAVTYIGGNAFKDCTDLVTVNFNATNCTTMCTGNTSVFSGCNHFTTLNIGSNVTNIPYAAFDGCSHITSVTIPNSVTTIGQYAFYGCTGLTQATIGSGVTTVNSSAFYNCTGLTRVNYSGSIDSWCEIAFASSSSNPLSNAHHLYLSSNEVTNLVIPNSVTSIGDYAFSGGTGFTSVTLGTGVTNIGESAFSGCNALNAITSLSRTPPALSTFAFNGINSSIPVYVPCGTVWDYRENWTQFSNFYDESGQYLITVTADQPFVETFESDSPTAGCWTQDLMVEPDHYWEFPAASSEAHGGTIFASFGHMSSGSSTMLISPTLDISSLSSPELKFYHIQQRWGSDQDTLKVYYRTAGTAVWTHLATYDNNVSSWTRETITLPVAATINPIEIGFCGKDGWGFGIKLDDIEVSGDPSAVQEFVSDFENDNNDYLDWVVSNGAPNKWVRGTAEHNGTGSRSFYISNDNGATSNYSNMASGVQISYLYRYAYLPAGTYNLSYGDL